MKRIILPDYQNSILNVSSTLLKHYGVFSSYDALPELEKALENHPKHVFLLLLDGMGYNIVKKYLKRHDFLRKHVKKRITSVFPSTTVAATNAVLTAKPPWSSGYLGWVQYLKDEDLYDTVFLNKDYYDEQKVVEENMLDKYFKQPQIFDLIQKAHPELVIHQLFPNFKINGFDTVDEELEKMVEISKQQSPSFTYIYWGEPDLTEHDEGPFSESTKLLVQSLNHKVSECALKLAKDSLLIVIADHGHETVAPINLYEDDIFMRMLEKMPSMEPRATSFFVKDNQKEKFQNYFNKHYGKYYALYSKEDLFALRLLGEGLKHHLVDDCIGDYLAIGIGKKYFQFKNKKPFKGHHAGLTANEMYVPLIIYET